MEKIQIKALKEYISVTKESTEVKKHIRLKIIFLLLLIRVNAKWYYTYKKVDVSPRVNNYSHIIDYKFYPEPIVTHIKTSKSEE